MKKFIITIDTEGDNLWNWKDGNEITTKNVYSLQQFQDLCNKYDFKPVYLSNWEMLQNDDFVAFIKNGLEHDICELGMHLHAWNTPPFYALPKCKSSGAPYLIEYPVEIMEEKIENITNLIKQKFGFIPVSHRAGRWAMNGDYFKLLRKYGYRIDCSYTPGISWRSSAGQTPEFGGTDYGHISSKAQTIDGILEVPMTIRYTHELFLPNRITLKNVVRMGIHTVKGQHIWMRPNGRNLKEMLWLVEQSVHSQDDYLMFMLHSSELLAGGSPTFPMQESIETLYSHLNVLFERIAENHGGTTLEGYYLQKQVAQ